MTLMFHVLSRQMWKLCEVTVLVDRYESKWSCPQTFLCTPLLQPQQIYQHLLSSFGHIKFQRTDGRHLLMEAHFQTLKEQNKVLSKDKWRNSLLIIRPSLILSLSRDSPTLSLWPSLPVVLLFRIFRSFLWFPLSPSYFLASSFDDPPPSCPTFSILPLIPPYSYYLPLTLPPSGGPTLWLLSLIHPLLSCPFDYSFDSPLVFLF